MTDEQRKHYEEAALRHANYYSAKVHANFHELPYFQKEIFSHFIDGVRYCLETEADNLKKEIEHKAIRIELERKAVVTINNKCTQLQEQLRVAVEALKTAAGHEPVENSLNPRVCSEALQKIEAMKGGEDAKT